MKTLIINGSPRKDTDTVSSVNFALSTAKCLLNNMGAELPVASAMWRQIVLIVQEELAKAKLPNSTIAIIQGESVEYLRRKNMQSDHFMFLIIAMN